MSISLCFILYPSAVAARPGLGKPPCPWEAEPDKRPCISVGVRRFGVTYEQMAARAPKVLQVDMAVPKWPAAARLGFVLKAHSADTLYSTERLLRWLYHPEYRFVVHFDRKGVSGELGCYFALKYAHLRNVALVPQIHAAWGHYGNSKAELLGFRMLHAMGGWDYAINLSGSTLPLVPPQALSCWVKSRLLDRGRVPGVVPTQVRHPALL